MVETRSTTTRAAADGNGTLQDGTCGSDLYVMIDGYVKKGSVREAERFWKEMEKKGKLADVYTFTTLIHGHCVNGKVGIAEKLFKEMKERGVPPSVVTYNALISDLSKEGKEEETFRLYDEMLEAGLIPDDCLLFSCGKSPYGRKKGQCIIEALVWAGYKSAFKLFDTAI